MPAVDPIAPVELPTCKVIEPFEILAPGAVKEPEAVASMFAREFVHS